MSKLLKNVFLVLIIFLGLQTNYLYAQTQGFGLGIMIGEPTGISGKYWIDSKSSLNFGIGWSIGASVHLHADYTFNNFSAIRASEKFVLFYGVGARIRSQKNNEVGLGVRGIIGIDWIPKEAPIDIALEVVPIFDLFPETSLKLAAAICWRYYFN